MATITEKLFVYFRPSKVGTKWEYSYSQSDCWADEDYIFVGAIDVSFENNIDIRAAQIELIEKAITKIDADHYAKKTQLETRRNELLAIGCDSVENDSADGHDSFIDEVYAFGGYSRSSSAHDDEGPF